MAKKSNIGPNYINTEQDLSMYIPEEDLLDVKEIRETTKDIIEKEKKVVSRIASAGPEDLEISPLERDTPMIVGSIFDRVKFLKERIDEAGKSIELRKKIHEEMVADMKADIKDKEEIAGRMTDMTDKRNFRLDISSLRKEMRNETVRFWKDLLELRTELSELLEMYETESKIVGIFKGMDGASC
jgi:hypothetical protein